MSKRDDHADDATAYLPEGRPADAAPRFTKADVYAAASAANTARLFQPKLAPLDPVAVKTRDRLVEAMLEKLRASMPEYDAALIDGIGRGYLEGGAFLVEATAEGDVSVQFLCAAEFRKD